MPKNLRYQHNPAKKEVRHLREARFSGLEISPGISHHAAPMTVVGTQAPPEKRSRSRKKLRCEDCYFHQNMLCALGLDEPCPTFRPAHPDGLRPPQQLMFIFRTPRPESVPAWPEPRGDSSELVPQPGQLDAGPWVAAPAPS
jgi:hypothetical protein